MFARAAREVEQGIDFGYCDSFRAFCNLHDFVAGADFSFFQYSEIESRPLMRYQETRHLRVGHADADPVTGHAWLCDLEQRSPYLIAVADADLVVREAFDGQVFAELTVFEVVAV